MFSRKRKPENPLVVSVNDLVRKVCEWEDACGGKYTVETEMVRGQDYISLDVKGVDEVLADNIMDIVAQDANIVRYVCNFAKQTLSFEFETPRRKVPNAPIVPASGPVSAQPDSYDDDALQKELITARLLFKETEEDLVMACKCVIAVRHATPVLNILAGATKFDYTSTPGLIRITVIGLAKVDAKLFAVFKRLRSDFDAEVVLIMSPREERCVTIRLPKAKLVINI
jgi:hypothetical protein